jgi:imidazolonepropionase-like amidohydrolase
MKGRSDPLPCPVSGPVRAHANVRVLSAITRSTTEPRLARIPMRCAGIALLATFCMWHACPRAHAQERPPVTDALRPYVSVDAPVVALTHVKLVDGTGSPARDDQTIIIDGDRIAAVGPSGTVTIPAGAHVLDLTGHTVLPGLVQLHEHTWLGGLRESVFMPWSAPLFLAAGVTTAMTTGTRFPDEEVELKRAIDAGEVPGPRLHITGPYITGGPRRESPNRIVTSAEEARSVVDEWADRGATWFKVLNGPADVLRWTISAAHERGLRVTIHPCSVTFAEAVSLGVDLIQHGFITASEYVPGKRPGECPPDNQRAQADVDVSSDAVQSSIRALAASGVGVVSTLAVYETFMPERAPDPRALSVLPDSLRREIEEIHAGVAASGFVIPERLLRRMMEWERAFVAAGGLLGAGSDPWGTGLLPGFGNLRNYELLVRAGFAPEVAVQIMTLNGARILGLEREIGSVEVGKVADLVVVRGDPVSQAGAIYEVVMVFRAGLGFKAKDLRRFAVNMR